jgi:hypothetical protein
MVEVIKSASLKQRFTQKLLRNVCFVNWTAHSPDLHFTVLGLKTNNVSEPVYARNPF